MEYLTLRNSDLRVSRLCVGGCPMGGYGWGTVREADLIRGVHMALDMGINFFDTADVYGLGQSEITLGKALNCRLDRAVIADKFGVRVENGRTFYDNSPQWIQTACDNSLRRLGVETIDLYQLHYRDGVTPMESVVETLEALRAAGKIRHFGLSNLTAEDAVALKKWKGSFVSFQNQYSLACRTQENAMLRLQQELALTPMTWGSLGQGVLTGKYRADSVFEANDRRSRDTYINFHGRKLLANLNIVEELRPIAAEHGKSISAVALRFILDKLPGSVAICGMKNGDQLLSNAQAAHWRLSPAELALLDTVSKEGTLP